jgi:hypothetical protein
MSHKTVFVIGAGASKEVNLPVGTELKKQIVDSLNFKTQRNEIRGIIDPAYSPYSPGSSIDTTELYRACSLIREAMPLAISIDNFLDAHANNKHIEYCGKLCIATTILKAERNSDLFFDPRNEDMPSLGKLENKWFSTFFHYLTEGCRTENLEDRLSSVVLVIFNYDRCVEHFIYYSLQKYYGMSEQNAAKLVQHIEIYHPYGQVGSLLFMPGEPKVGFGSTPHYTTLIDLTSKIKTFTEGTDEKSSDIQVIRTRISEARRLIFVGFSFHSLNMDLLLPRPVPVKNSDAEIYATTYRLSHSDVGIIEKDLIERGGFKEDNIKLSSSTCSQFFQDYRRAFSFR